MRSPSASPARARCGLRQHAVGINFIDIYHRTGLYPVPNKPAVIGMEGAGTVEAVGPGVGDLKVGDRVAYAGVLGGYAEERLIAADRLVKLPDDIDFATAASMMLRGMTVRYLLRETYPCTAETVLLFHAAAGGVGLIACQWARAIGATMIGTVGSDAKAQIARDNGCTHVINYRTEDYVARVKEITGGRGCDVVYDSVGKDTFPSSLDCLKPKGLWVSFGNSSGPVPPFDWRSCRRRARSTPRVRRSWPTWRARRTCAPTRRSCSRWWRRARCVLRSARAIRCARPPPHTATWKGARRRARSCSSPNAAARLCAGMVSCG